jgi:transposase
VADTLAGYDLAVIVQRPMATAHFHDNRLGLALDALWTAGLDRGYGAVISQAIRQYALALTRLHTSATSLKVYRTYARDEHEEGPLVTYGYSRDHRPDLKQLLFGLTATAEGVPVWGHITDGNQSDNTEHCCHITQLRHCLTRVSRSWWPTASSLRAKPSPWRQRTGFALSLCGRRRWACDKR